MAIGGIIDSHQRLEFDDRRAVGHWIVEDRAEDSDKGALGPVEAQKSRLAEAGEFVLVDAMDTDPRAGTQPAVGAHPAIVAGGEFLEIRRVQRERLRAHRPQRQQRGDKTGTDRVDQHMVNSSK